ncbi:MAG: hypothetical protein V3V08_13400, partial [Nannocystaceae bacterium]
RVDTKRRGTKHADNGVGKGKNSLRVQVVGEERGDEVLGPIFAESAVGGTSALLGCHGHLIVHSQKNHKCFLCSLYRENTPWR